MGDSVADVPESIIGNAKKTTDNRVSKKIPEVIIEEQEISIKREPPKKKN